MIPFSEWAPDRSPFDPKVSDTILNVVPKAASYGPMPAFVSMGDALPAKPQGAILVPAGGGNFEIFAGTTNNLYKLDVADLSWEDVSGASYNTGTDEAWSFTQFGELVVASNKADATQKFELGTSTDFADLANAPKGLYPGIIGDFLAILNTEASEQQIRWSGRNAPEGWTVRRQGSDFQNFPDGGALRGFAGFERGAVIFQDSCIREMSAAYDTPLIFTFQKTDESRGCAAPRSIVTAGGQVFFLSHDGFYRYGRPCTPIGTERVDDFFTADADPEFVYEVQGAADPVNKIVYWRYRSQAHNQPNTTDRILAYHYALDRWSLIEHELAWLFPVASPGYTLDSLDDLGFSLDDLPFSLDSRAWTAGLPLIGGFDADYKLGFFSGEPMAATLRTGDVELSPGKRTFVRGFRPIVDTEAATGRVARKDTHGGAKTWGPVASQLVTGLIPARSSGRLHTFEVTIPEGEAWAHIHGVVPDGRQEGKR